MLTQWGLYWEQAPLIKNTGKLLARGLKQKSGKKTLRLNKETIGNLYRAKIISVTPQKIRQFAQALQDPNPYYTSDSPSGEQVAPPLFGIVPTMHSLVMLFSDKKVNVDFSNLLLVGQQADFYRLVRAGERIYSTSMVRDIVDKKGGQLLIVQSDGYSEKGEHLYRDYSNFYIRDRKKFFSGMKDLRGADHLWQLPDSTRQFPLEDCPIPKGQILAYSKISGDYDPFHYFGFISRMFGYGEKFLQGTSLTAFSTKLLINGPLGGNPHALKRVCQYFWEKVQEGDRLKAVAWKLHPQEKGNLWHDPESPELEGETYGYQVTNQDKSMIIPKGVALAKT